MIIPDIAGTREMPEDVDHGTEAACASSEPACDCKVEEEEGRRTSGHDPENYTDPPAARNIRDSEVGTRISTEVAPLKCAADMEIHDELMIPLNQRLTSTTESASKTLHESGHSSEGSVIDGTDNPNTKAGCNKDYNNMGLHIIEKIQDSEQGMSKSTEVAPLKCAVDMEARDEISIPLNQRSYSATESAPRTPQELYMQIENSRDKLFFIAYAEPPDSTRWYLVRVDLSSSGLDEETRDCENTGKYYVEYYAKASYDQGILLAGYPLEDGIPAAQMKPKPDSESRYWLEWHEFHFDKNEEMVLGKWKEFPPNTTKAINRRLIDLSLNKLGQKASNEYAIDDGVERHMYDKYTIWANIVDLMDVKTRLVGPFDFDDIELPPLTEEFLAPFDEEKKKLFVANYDNLIVKDRVPWSRWQELLEALKGRDIIPPTVVDLTREAKKITSKSCSSSEKRARIEEVASLFQDTSVKRSRANPSVVCHECRTNDEGKGKLLTFPASSAQASLHVHVSCAKESKSNMIVTRERAKREIASLLESTLAETRRAPVGHGRAYYVINELKDALKEAVDKWAGDSKLSSSSSRVKKALSVNPTERTRVQQRATQPTQPHDLQAAKSQMLPCKPLQGLFTADFTKEEIDSFPVAYAYYMDDPDGVSEENAKIATLNHEAKQRRLRRSSVPAHSPTLTPTPAQPKNATHRTESNSIFRRGIPHTDELLSQHSPEPAEDFPEGWMIIKKKRSCTGSKVYDRFWYSPKNRYMLRSRPEVHRFLEALKKSGGDENKAIEMIGMGKKRK